MFRFLFSPIFFTYASYRTFLQQTPLSADYVDHSGRASSSSPGGGESPQISYRSDDKKTDPYSPTKRVKREAIEEQHENRKRTASFQFQCLATNQIPEPTPEQRP